MTFIFSFSRRVFRIIANLAPPENWPLVQNPIILWCNDSAPRVESSN